jgi:hypothetical protein
MDTIKYLDYYVGIVPEGSKGIAVSLSEAREIVNKVRIIFEKYNPTSLDDRTFVYSNDVNWSLSLREPSVSSLPFITIFDEVENDCFRKLFIDNKILHDVKEIGEF